MPNVSREAATGSHALEAKDFAMAALPLEVIREAVTISLHLKGRTTTIPIILDGKIRRKGACR